MRELEQGLEIGGVSEMWVSKGNLRKEISMQVPGSVGD